MTSPETSAASATTVALAASTIPGEFLVPDLVDAFAAQHPEFAVETTITDSAGVFEALRAGRAEVGVAGAEPDGDDLTATVLAEDEIVLAVPATHPLASSGTVTVEQLADQAMVEREEGSGTRRSFVDALAERGTALVGPRWTVRDSNAELLAAVADGEGLGVISAWALDRHGSGDLRAVRVAGGPIRRSLYLVLPAGGPDAELGPAATTFVELARGEAP